jgi:XTP/dITP diphosphohydrolase
MEEFKAESDKNTPEMEEEFGDVLFSLVNYARFVNINPENALAKTNKKFIDRFMLLEQLIRKDGLNINTMDLPEMDIYWEKAKGILKDRNH